MTLLRIKGELLQAKLWIHWQKAKQNVSGVLTLPFCRLSRDLERVSLQRQSVDKLASLERKSVEVGKGQHLHAAGDCSMDRIPSASPHGKSHLDH
jgi:hypothetical protein